MGTRIEWTDETRNPVRGCRRKTEECENCFAERLAATRLAHTPLYEGLAEMKSGGPRWTGKVNLRIDDMKQALRWTKPRRSI